MKLEKGCIVKSIAGRDKDGYFCIFEHTGDYVLIADGKERKISKPKRKKIKHIQLTPYKVDIKALQANKHLKRAIDSLMNF